MAGRPLVLDASTAILLGKVDLLRDLARRSELVMVEGTFREATVKETAPDAGIIRQLAEDGLIRVSLVPASGRRLREDFRLDEGEAETILLARETGAVAGTDDGPAIRCLKVLGLPFTSAVALTVGMADAGYLAGDLALEALNMLERIGRYDPRILEDAARRVREGARR